jgi:hypothetical protein
MKMRVLLLPLCAMLLASCNDSSSSTPTATSSRNDSSSSTPTASDSTPARIEAGLVGSWAKPNATFATDTLIFTDSKYRTPYLSGNGSLFSATGGVAKGGPGMAIVGKYLLDKDTLYFDAILGSAPSNMAVTKTAYNRYLRVGN